MSQNIMLDLETFGTGNKAAIASIGAVKFNETDILDEFHVGVDPASCQALGLTIDAGTVMWWLDPARAEARANLLALQKVDLASTLVGFTEWAGNDVEAIWGNGATFDNIILRSAYEACRMEYPVRFWQDQCYRTIKYTAPHIQLIREGTHHDALDDARCQAKHLQAIWQDRRDRDALLAESGRQFRFYEGQHRAKIDATLNHGSDDPHAQKAEVNAELAGRIEELLR